MVHCSLPLTILRSMAEQKKGGMFLAAQDEAKAADGWARSLPEVATPLHVGDVGSGNKPTRGEVHWLFAEVGNGVVIVQEAGRFLREIVSTVQRVRQILCRGAVYITITQGFNSRSPNSENTRKQGERHGN